MLARLALVLALLPAAADAAPWRLDPATRIVVDVPWQGSAVAVRFPAPTGTIDFDPERPETARATVTVSARGATTGVAIVDALVKSADYLGAETWPEMTFRLDRLTPTSKQTAEVAGRLTLRGVTRPVAFEARVIRFGPAADDPDRFEAGFDLTGAIDRTAFGSTGGLPEVTRGAADPHPAADAFGLTMRLRDSADGWGAVTRLLHWGMAALILFQLGFGLWMTRVPDLLQRFLLTQTHKSLGTTIFALALLRLGWRLANRRPPLPPAMPAWQRRAARLSHAALYGLMLLLPLSGWLMASASPTQDLLGMQNLVFGRWPLPDPFVPGDARVEAAAHAVHAGAAIALALLLALHAAAALRHQFVDRDGLLARMIHG